MSGGPDTLFPVFIFLDRNQVIRRVYIVTKGDLLLV